MVDKKLLFAMLKYSTFEKLIFSLQMSSEISPSKLFPPTLRERNILNLI